jgi:hypothetical protein
MNTCEFCHKVVRTVFIYEGKSVDRKATWLCSPCQNMLMEAEILDRFALRSLTALGAEAIANGDSSVYEKCVIVLEKMRGWERSRSPFG